MNDGKLGGKKKKARRLSAPYLLPTSSVANSTGNCDTVSGFTFGTQSDTYAKTGSVGV